MRKIILAAFVFTALQSNAQLGSDWDWANISATATSSPGRQVIDIATDNSGNVYATGRFQGSMTLGAYTVATSGDGSVNFNYDEDAFIVKYNSAGVVQWLRKYGVDATGSNQIGQVITVDSSGNVYIGGSGINGSSTGNAFLVKYDAAGNVLWSKIDFPLYEIGGINLDADDNLIVQESNGGAKNIYKINGNNGSIIWTVANTGAGCNSTTTFQDFVDDAGNIYYTCFGTGASTIAGQNFNTTNVTTFIASVDSNGITRWVQAIDNVQVQLAYTIDRSNGKSYAQISGGFGGTFQGISTGSNRYLELDSNGILTRYAFQSPYKGLFRVKGDKIYGFTTEQNGFAYTLTYGTYNFISTTDNTKAFGIVIEYDKNTDAVTWANSFYMNGTAWNSGKLNAIELSANKIIVGGLAGTGVTFGTNTFATTTSSGIYPSDLFISQGTLLTLGIQDFASNSLAIYPNPAQNFIQFSREGLLNVSIYSMSGQVVLRKQISSNAGLDISGLSSGLYIVEASGETGFSIRTKLLKN